MRIRATHSFAQNITEKARKSPNLKVFAFGAGCLLYLTFVVFTWSAPGIIIQEGFENGVALCQGGEDLPLEHVPGYNSGYQWRKDGIYYMINAGSESDPKIAALVELATEECATYLQD